MATKQLNWLNCTKFIAILAVITDHVNGVCYTNTKIQYFSYFSVSLFILIAGYLSYKSIDKNQFSYFKTVFHSTYKIICAYILATFVYHICIIKSFDILTFLNQLIHFNASGPFYYVSLYIQLMLISQPLYVLISHKYNSQIVNNIKDVILSIFIVITAFLATKYTNILSIYGGGGKLFGGTFLILFYIGMLFAKFDLYKNISTEKSIIFTVSFGALWGGLVILCTSNLYSNDLPTIITDKNPPGVIAMVSAIIVFNLCYGLFNVLDSYKFTTAISHIIGWAGKHTLYIFLYHLLFLGGILTKYINLNNLYIKAPVYYIIMITGPIIIDYIMQPFRNLIKLK